MTVYRVANLTWQWRHDRRLIRQIARDADVVGMVEARMGVDAPVDVAGLLNDPDFDVRQDTSSSARGGSAIAVNISENLRVRRSWLRRISDGGHGVQARYERVTVVVEPGWVTRVIVAHNPLPSTGRQRQAIRRSRATVARTRTWVRRGTNAARRTIGMRQRRWIWLGDANMRPDEWARHLGAPHHFGVKPMVACWSHGFGDVQIKAARYEGSDHAVLTVTTR